MSLNLVVPGTGAEVTTVARAEAPVSGAPKVFVEDMATTSVTNTLGAYLGLAALMGALSLLTPCVFPMVPITVSYFTGRAEKHRRGAVAQALVYGAGIVLTFTGVGAVLALGFGAAGLNQFAANPWLNLGIAALFIAFALNLFGVFELALPSKFLTRASTADSGRGRYVGTLLMGLAFTLTSFTCTAPFLGTLLVVAAQGDWQWPLAGLLVFSSVFALPFVLLAWAPQAVAALPRSGAWLLSVKATMGLLELAAALKFLSNVDLVWGWGVFTRDVVIALWLIIGAVMVAYLAGGLRLGHAPRLSRPGLPRWMTVAAALALTVWLGTGLAGRRLGEAQAVGVDELAGENLRPDAIGLVADHRVTDGSKMHPDLMGAAGENADFQQGVALEMLDDAVLAFRLAAGFSDGHLFAVQRVAADRSLDDAVRWFDAALDQHQVDFGHFALLELFGQGGLYLPRPGDDHQAGGVFIEAMDDARPVALALGQFRVAAEQGVEQRAVRVPRRRVGGQARRFVDDGQIVVLINHFERDVLRDEAAGRRRGDGHHHPVAGL